jgi:hypothetical protein
MHTLPVMFAYENYGGLLVAIVLVYFIPLVGSLLGIAIGKHWPKVAFVFGILGILSGGLVLVWLFSNREDAPPVQYVYYAIASLPLLAGLICVARWRRYRK